jgi:CRISPR system Cascade subunit CasD
LLAWPRIAKARLEHKDEPLRLILEHASAGAVRLDQPVAPYAERRFGPRYIASEAIDVPV